MKGQPRSRPAPTIGQRVVVRLVPVPEHIRPVREQYLRGLIRRCLPAPVAVDEGIACPS